MSASTLLAGLVASFGVMAAAVAAQADPSDAELAISHWRGHSVVAGRLLVGHHADADEDGLRTSHAALEAVVVARPAPGLELVRLPDGTALDAAIEHYRARSDVSFAEPDVLMAGAAGPNDPHLALQWSLHQVSAPAVWDGFTGAATSVVAILDSGTTPSHPDLAASYAGGYDYFDGDADPDDQTGHGTHCSGIAAATTDNDVGVAGAGYRCRFRAYRCGDGLFPTSVLTAAIYGAVADGAHVLSMSWGSGYDSASIRQALAAAWAQGCVLVAAAGNDDSSQPFFPAALPTVIGVASSTPIDSRSSFSNYGAWVDVAAPGQSVYSTWHNGHYAYSSGTSTACPLVAGMAALLYSTLGDVRTPQAAERVRHALLHSTEDVGNWVQYGRVDFPAALTELGALDPPALHALSPTSVPAFGGGTVTVTGTGLLGATAVVVDGSPPTATTVLGDDRLTFDVVSAPGLGPTDVRVVEGGVPSAPLTLTFLETAPPGLSVTPQVAPGETLTWSYGGGAHHGYLLLISGSPQTFPFRGSALLAAFVPIYGGTLDAAGLGALSVTLPATALGVTFYSQLATMDGHFAGASAVQTTTIAP